jgi:CheY-like chemotaxis protein
MSQSDRPKYLLIADDDDDDKILMEEIVHSYRPDIKTTCLANGKELMEYLSEKKAPDLLLLDLNMPYKGGLQCLKEMRKERSMSLIPVVVLSTSSHPHDADQCFYHGADLFFTKPWDIGAYTMLIHGILDIDWSRFRRPADMEHFRKIAYEGKPSLIYY